MDLELLERDEELAKLAGLIDGALTGSGGLLIVEGVAGYGKTALLRAAREIAQDAGADVLTARGGGFERSFPFGVARQLLEAPLAAASPNERRGLLRGPAAVALRGLGLTVAPTDGRDGDDMFAVLHGLYWLTVNLAERAALVLVVDDLQWVDDMTLRWLDYLFRRIEGLRVLVIAALRSGEPMADASAVDVLIRDANAHTMTLAALTIDAVKAFVTARLGSCDAQFAAACHKATAGNPFMLGELLGALTADAVVPDAAGAERVGSVGPATVARAIFLRLSRLPGGTDRLATAVAVLGLDAELRHAAALAQLDERVAAQAADALSAAGILASGRPLDFVHPIVRAAVYGELPAEQRALAHRDAARLLAREGADVDRVAGHLCRSAPAGDPEAVPALRRAADRARARGATAAAIAYLRRALEEPPERGERGGLQLELGSAERHANDPAAIEHLKLAADASDDPLQRCHALRELSRAFVIAGRMQHVVDASDAAIDALGGQDPDVAAEIEAELIAAGQMGMLPGYSIKGRIARLRSTEIDDATAGGRLLLAVLAFEAMRSARPARETRAIADRALQRDAALEPVADSVPRYLALLALLYTDGFEQTEERCERELAAARAHGSAFGFSTVSVILGELAYRRGQLADAESHAAAILDVDVVDNALIRGWAISVHIQCLLERGETDAAAATLALTGIDALAPEQLLHNLLFARAGVRIARGDTRAGLEDLTACGRVLTTTGSNNSAPVPWRPAAALAHASLGERSDAQRLADEELDYARHFGAPRALGIALRAAGLVRGGPASLQLLEEAVATLAGSGAQLEHARALTDLGAAMRRARHRVAAREPLRHGLQLADGCQATALSTRAHEELIATGARPRRRAQTGTDSLTPSERRVAQLAARGLSNRDIAQALFVTVKTIETHLGHIYAKLGITSRAALPTERQRDRSDALTPWPKVSQSTYADTAQAPSPDTRLGGSSDEQR